MKITVKLVFFAMLLAFQESTAYRDRDRERERERDRIERMGIESSPASMLLRSREKDSDSMMRGKDKDSQSMSSITTYETVVPPPERFLHSLKNAQNGIHEDDYTPRSVKYSSSSSNYNRGNSIPPETPSHYSGSHSRYEGSPSRGKNHLVSPTHNPLPSKEDQSSFDTEESMADMQPPKPPKLLLPRVTLRHDGPAMFGGNSHECKKCGGFTLGVGGTCCSACGKLGYNRGCWCRSCDCLCYDT